MSDAAETGSPRSPELILVRVVDDERLKPFEEQTLILSREALTISRNTYLIGVLAFLTALAAAVFVATQVYEMTKQTMIMASQSEGANAGALMDEMNTRKQLQIAQSQAVAAQQSVFAIQRQMRQDQRAWMQITMSTTYAAFGPYEPIIVPLHFVNTGKTAALDVVAEGVVAIVSNKEQPKLSYKGAHAHKSSGIVYRDSPFDVSAYTCDKTCSEAALATLKEERPSNPASQLGPTDYYRLISGKAYLVFYGKVEYRDIFKVKHWTHFCAPSPIPNAPAVYASKKCSDYNRADNN